jgi:hypothetical protein
VPEYLGLNKPRLLACVRLGAVIQGILVSLKSPFSKKNLLSSLVVREFFQ